MEDHAQVDEPQTRDIAAIRPKCRPWSDFAVERIAGGLMLFDSTTMQYHTLNDAAERIWLAADGSASIEDIARSIGLPVDVVETTICELADISLVQSPAPRSTIPIDRRRATRWIAAGAVGVPVVISITAPEPAAAASPAFCRDHGYLGITCVDRWDCQVECPPMSEATCVQVDSTGVGCCKCSNTASSPIGD